MKFYSNGKLLITGEYAVLKGALSLAIPSKFGQYLDVSENSTKFINWKSKNRDGKVWFECKISIKNLNVEETTSNEISNRLVKIISLIKEYNPSFLTKTGSKISTKLTFDKNWGLGSSSTLISNLSKLANVDPYIINSKIFKGSGYDIACANSNSPILYKIKKAERIIKETNFNPIFKNKIYFVFLNKKQSSLAEIKRYKSLKPSNLILSEISDITLRISNCKNEIEFIDLISSHEKIISKLISKKPIKDILFKDFKGEIKSLGAWGGDFILTMSEDDPSSYFRSKGYNTIFKYQELLA